MQLSGSLAEYSLAEIFNFIYEGSLTGLLTLFPYNNGSTAILDPHYLWFERGRIIALTNGISGSELLTKILQRKLISSAEMEPIGSILYQLPQPLGIYLKTRGLLDGGQLKLLFNAQSISPICRLFESKNRQFQFEISRLPINAEITGISLPCREVGMLGLRLLKDWSGLSAKLPDPSYAIERLTTLRPNIELNRHELQLWNLADGQTSLIQIAAKMSLSIDIIRQISFRLSTFGIIHEVPFKLPHSIDSNLIFADSITRSKSTPVSNSFLGNLKKFLRKIA